MPETSPETWITGLALIKGKEHLTLAPLLPDRLNFSDALTFQLSGMDKGRKMLEMLVMIGAQVPVARGIDPIEERMYEAWRRYGRSFEMVLKIGSVPNFYITWDPRQLSSTVWLSLSQKLGSAGVDMVKGMGGRGTVG